MISIIKIYFEEPFLKIANIYAYCTSFVPYNLSNYSQWYTMFFGLLNTYFKFVGAALN